MKRTSSFVLVVVCLALGVVLSGCVTGGANADLCTAYQFARPVIVEIRASIKADPASVKPDLLEKFNKLEPWLPTLDALGSESCKGGTGFTVPPEVRQIVIDFAAASLSQAITRRQ